MHLAPSTDSRTLRIMKFRKHAHGSASQQEKLDHEMELGFAGFYGIANEADVYLGMLLMTSCFEVMDQPGLSASGRWRSCSLFNNP